MSIFMMGLNKDTHDTLQPTDGITQPDEIALPSGEPVVVDPDAGVVDEGGEKVLNNLDEYDIIVQIGDDHAKEEIRLEEISKIVMASEAISYGDVETMFNALEKGSVKLEGTRVICSGMAARLNEMVPVASFTERPSKQNLEDLRRFVKSEEEALEEKKEALVVDFFTSRAEDFLVRGELIRDAIALNVTAQEKWRDKCIEQAATAAKSKNTLSYFSAIYINKKDNDEQEPLIPGMLSGEDIECMTNKTSRSRRLEDIRFVQVNALYENDSPSVELSHETAAGLSALLCNPKFGVFIKTINTHNNTNRPFNDPRFGVLFNQYSSSNTGEDYRTISYSELIRLPASGILVSILNSLHVTIGSFLEMTKVFLGQYKNNQPFSFNDIEYNYRDAAGFISKFLSGASDVIPFIDALESFQSATEPFFNEMDVVFKA